MNKREAAVLGAYTGLMFGEFTDLHEYIEEIMGRPVFTQELRSEELSLEIKKRSRDEFMSICSSIN